MSKKEKKLNPITGRAGQSIDLAKFNIKTEKAQYEEVENLLKEIYQDDLEVNKKHVYKCIKLTYNPKNDYTFLPHNLKVSKEKLTLKFTVEAKRSLSFGWVLFSIWLFIFALIGATYAGFAFSKVAHLNKDIDGDGIPDINIDINNDKIADINIDIDGDNKPDLNIDYKGNRKARFNIDTNGDGKPDFNLVNDATGGKCSECKINCDINGDGWPDINLDIDGDGIPDLDIDTDGDCIPDLNIDLDGDEKCDLFCDTDGDGKCDVNCTMPQLPNEPGEIPNKPDENEPPKKETGSSVENGPSVDAETSYIIIEYTGGESINVTGLMPDDQDQIPGYIPGEKPVKDFTVENLSNYPVFYTLRWKVATNNFVTNNLKYHLTSTNGGPNFRDLTVPKANGEIIQANILILPRTIQKYKLEIYLKGTGQPQNDDQGKVFIGNIEVIT